MKIGMQVGVAILIVTANAAASAAQANGAGRPLVVSPSLSANTQRLSGLAPGSKVVFLKEKEVLSANADGSDQEILTHDGIPKERPVWSPDGTKVAYVTALSAEDVFRPPKVLALINVITADGRLVKTIPVPAAMTDGTPILGMRFVEDSGWFGDSAVFVSGSENPHYAEYRIFDVPSTKLVQSYAGYGFTTCASKAEVAYVAYGDDADPKKLQVQVNGKDLIQVPAESDPRYFQWSADCDRLAYIDGEGDRASLVVLRKNVVEARVPLGAGFDGAMIVPAGKGFLLRAVRQTKYYDVTKKAFGADLYGLQGMPVQILQESASELVKRLGGTSVNVWSPK